MTASSPNATATAASPAPVPPAPPAPPLPPASSAGSRRPFGRTALSWVALTAAVLAAGAYGAYWWTTGRFHEETDDAYVGGDVTVVGAKVGGYIAEQIVYSDVSTGAQNDLQRATDMARQMITQFGMSEQLGLATYEDAPNPLLAGSGLAQRDRKEYSEATAQLIDSEVRKVLADASMRVTATLQGQRARLEALAQMLLEKEVVDRRDLDMILAANVTPLPPPKQGPGPSTSSPAAMG